MVLPANPPSVDAGEEYYLHRLISTTDYLLTTCLCAGQNFKAWPLPGAVERHQTLVRLWIRGFMTGLKLSAIIAEVPSQEASFERPTSRWSATGCVLCFLAKVTENWWTTDLAWTHLTLQRVTVSEKHSSVTLDPSSNRMGSFNSDWCHCCPHQNRQDYLDRRSTSAEPGFQSCRHQKWVVHSIPLCSGRRLA